MKDTNQGLWPEGINNRQRAFLPVRDKYGRIKSVRNAVNVDVDASGKLSLRPGCQRLTTQAGAHDGFSCPAGTFLMEGQRLKRLEDDDTLTDLGQLTGSPVVYCYAPDGNVYLSDGLVNRRIVSGSLDAWTTPVPPAPLVYGASGGSFPAGRYLAAVTFVTSDGRESGASPWVSVDLVDGSKVVLQASPAAPHSGVSYVRLYMTQADGSVLHLRGTTTTGAVNFQVLTDDGGSGRVLDATHLLPMPPGRIIREYGGRMLVAEGNVLWISEPYDYGRVNMSKGYVQFSADVTVVEPVKTGVFVVAEKTYFLGGQAVDNWQPIVKADYGAVYGTSLRDSNDNPVWTSTRGVVSGGQDGSYQNLTETNVAMDSGTSGSSMLREQDGVRQFVTSIQDPSMSLLAAGDWMDMEVIRRGTTP